MKIGMYDTLLATAGIERHPRSTFDHTSEYDVTAAFIYERCKFLFVDGGYVARTVGSFHHRSAYNSLFLTTSTWFIEHCCAYRCDYGHSYIPLTGSSFFFHTEFVARNIC